jgi:hypothetical protein
MDDPRRQRARRMPTVVSFDREPPIGARIK